MRLYDTVARAAVTIEPITPGVLRVYACGPTVYRDAHVGNMRTFLLTDLITRVARDEGLRTQVIQNITDVGHMADDTRLGGIDEGQGGTDDRVVREAETTGSSAYDIARRYEAAFHRDLAALNIHPADEYPRASDWIDAMIELIGDLIASGHAYIGDDHSVYFDVRSVPDYGRISGNRIEDLRAGHKFDAGAPTAKRFHADWALWKHAGDTRTQMVWDTPWGRGFPGWHIECSAMSVRLLGPRIDLHTGGIDLRFPHHEDERAQSNAAVGHDVVNTWVHAEHLLFDGRKMSKSAGNVILVDHVIQHGIDPLALRLAFLQHRYRQQMNLTWSVIEGAATTLSRWRTRVADWATSPSRPIPDTWRHEFRSAVADDLDTPRALQVLHQVEREPGDDGAKFEFFAWADRILGLDLARDVGRTREVPDEVRVLLDDRARARAAKDWAESDALRTRIMELGFQVVDGPEGQSVQPR